MSHTPLIFDAEDAPALVGTLKIKYGLNGFEKALPGHPVFLYRDRYCIFLKSEVELRERMFDTKLGGDRTYIGYFSCLVPFFKDTLKEFVEFNQAI